MVALATQLRSSAASPLWLINAPQRLNGGSEYTRPSPSVRGTPTPSAFVRSTPTPPCAPCGFGSAETAAMWAALKSHVDTIRILHEHGANNPDATGSPI